MTEELHVYYPCCRRAYVTPVVGDPDNLARVIDCCHDAEHPEASGANPPWRTERA